MSSQAFDLLVIGAGPGGYVCAFRAAQLGLKVALVDKRKALGGTCLNVGCIPSKALLHSSEHFAFAQKHAAEHGLLLGDVQIDLPTLHKKKDAVVNQLTGGVASLAKARKITVLTGEARFADKGSVRVGSETYTAKNIVIATGSAPIELPSLPFDGKTIVSSDHAIALPRVPKTFVVVGGGAIGLELGSVWSRLGAQVTVVELLPQIGGTCDADVARALTRSLEKQGLAFELNAKVIGYDAKTGQLSAEREGQTFTVAAEQVLISVGRRPYTDGLDLDKAGVELSDKKRIKVDDHLRTNVEGIWALGDVIDGPMLAHKAEEDGVAVAEWIAGKAGHVNWDLVPAIIYTDPEVATVGLGEEAAKAKGLKIKTGKFNFAANGRALAAHATEGFVKIIADAGSDKILGAQMIGRNVGELISEVVTHMEYGGSAEDLGRTIHAHPTMSEAVKEAGLAVSRSAIHAL